MKQKLLNSLRLQLCTIVACLLCAFNGQAWGQTFQKITSETDLEYGSKYIIVCESKAKAMGSVNTYGAAVDVTITNNTITPSSNVVTLTLKGSKSGGWIFEVDSSNELVWTSGNSLNMNGKGTGNKWTISFTDGNVSIANNTDNNRKLVYNAGSPRFACYTSAQTAVQLYREVISASAVATTTTIDATGITNTDVYTSTDAGSLSASVTADGTAVEGATVTWSSSNTNVATIDANGAVTLVAAGTTTITASYAGVTDQYQASSTTYELTVTNSAPYVQPTIVEITPNYAFWGKTAQFSGSTYSELSGSKDNVNLSWSRGDGSTYANTTAMRFYKDNELTFTAPEGYEIKSIVLTVSGTYSDLSFAPTGYDNETTTWTGSSETVTMSRPSNADSYATISKFTITIGLPSTDPSISADDVEIAYNATSGSFIFTINNPVDGGSTNVSGNVDWISDAAVSGNNVTFTATANETKVERSAIVTLTYTYGDNETVTKEVTITQAGNPNAVDNISAITKAGTYTVRGTIVAKSQRGFIVGDGTGYVYYYNQNYTQTDYNIGDKVQLSGSVVVYGGVFEFDSSTTITTATESNYETEEPSILTGSQMDTRVGSTTPAQLSTYVQYEGTLSVSGNYYNIENIDGASKAIGSISYPINTDFTSLDGKIVKVTGYYVGVSSSTYYNTLIVSVEEVLETSITAEDVNIYCDATSGEISYTINNPIDGTSLTASEEVDWISNVAVDATKVTFTTTANTGAERSGVITLTYGSITKNVTVTQAAQVTGDQYQLFTGALVEGDYIIYYDGNAMNTTVTSDRLQYEEVTPINDVITTDNAAIVWHIAPSGEYWTIYNAAADAYAASTGAKNKAQMLADGTDDKALWTVSGTETYDFANKARAEGSDSGNKWLRKNGTYGFACYATSTGGALSLYKKVEATPDYTRTKPTSSVYGTLCLPYDATITGGTLYNIASASFTDSNTPRTLQSITLVEVGTTAEAGKGYIIKFSADEMTATFTSTNEVSTPIANNGLIGNPTTTGQTVAAGASNFVLQAGQLRYCNDKAATNGEYRAYIDASQIENHEVPVGVKSINLFLNGVDAIDGINSVIENAEIYNIAGQRMNKLQRGVNIVNGKKVLVK